MRAVDPAVGCEESTSTAPGGNIGPRTVAIRELVARWSADPSGLLSAAVEQFTLTGIRRTTLDDIAGRVGVNRVTLYRRVGSKSDIVTAALRMEAAHSLDRILDAVGATRVRDSDERREEMDDRRGDLLRAEAIIRTLVHRVIEELRSNRLLESLVAVDRDETLAALTVNATAVLELSAAVLAAVIDDLRDEIRRRDDGAGGFVTDTAVLAGLLTRMTQSVVVSGSGPLPLATPGERDLYVDQIVIPLAFGRTPG